MQLPPSASKIGFALLCFFKLCLSLGSLEAILLYVNIMKSRRDERHLAPLTNALRNNARDVIYYCLFIATIAAEYFPAISTMMFPKC